MANITTIRFKTVIGTIAISCDPNGERITEITVLKEPLSDQSSQIPLLNQAKNQVLEYFAGKRTVFDLPLDFAGTDLQKKIWKTVQEIPFGKTCSYGEIANLAGRPGAARAVGHAMHLNRFLLAVPCHRVVAASRLGNYSGGQGIYTKIALLNHEKEVLNASATLKP